MQTSKCAKQMIVGLTVAVVATVVSAAIVVHENPSDVSEGRVKAMKSTSARVTGSPGPAPRERAQPVLSQPVQVGKNSVDLGEVMRRTRAAFQLRDVRKLIASGADEAYLHAWGAKLGVDALLRRCMDERYDP